MGRMHWTAALAVAAGMAWNAGAVEPVTQGGVDARIELQRSAQRDALLRQRARYPALFARAYRAYPQIPRGTLEAVAWAQSRWQPLEAAVDGDAGHHHMPTAWGPMGLYAGDGFADQVGEAAAVTGLPADRIRRDPTANILAAAALLARAMQRDGVVPGVAVHSLVAMIEAAYRHHGLDWRYINVEVSPDDLADAVRGARAMGWRGFNCSIPHKVAVIDHLDGLGKSAEIIGAVNTIVRDGDRLHDAMPTLPPWAKTSSTGISCSLAATASVSSVPAASMAFRYWVTAE